MFAYLVDFLSDLDFNKQPLKQHTLWANVWDTSRIREGMELGLYPGTDEKAWTKEKAFNYLHT